MKMKIASFLTSAFLGVMSAIGLFQYLPGLQFTGKKLFLAALVFFLTTGFSDLSLTFMQKKGKFSVKELSLLGGISLLAGFFIAFFFQLSLPHKEFLMDQAEIKISVNQNFKKTESDTGIRFLSLNNGQRGISFEQFEKKGEWERNDQDQLILKSNEGGESLLFHGAVGQNASLFFITGDNAGMISIDWGDGALEFVDLNRPGANAESLRVSHDYGIHAGKREFANFIFNMLPIGAFISCLIMAYLSLVYALLRKRSRAFILSFLLISCGTLFIRITNCYTFPLGWDEGTYSRAAMRYADLAMSYQLKEIPNLLYNHEHPAFIKILFSVPVSLDAREEFARFGWNAWNRGTLAREDHAIFTGRFISAIFSLLLVQALCYLIHPAAGFFLVIHSLAEEYGAQARLEAVPMLTSFLSVWFFNRFLQKIAAEDKNKQRTCLLFSAIFLGMTAASKLIYCAIIFPMGLMSVGFILRNKSMFKTMAIRLALFALVSLCSFYLFNPSIWYHPIERVRMMVTFHENYQTGASDIYPFWQPIAWITRSVAHQSGRFFEKSPLAKSPQFFFFSCDELIFLLACAGSILLYKKERIYILWFLFGIIFLFLWGTKWEQYACLVTVPICISAYHGLFLVSERLKGCV